MLIKVVCQATKEALRWQHVVVSIVFNHRWPRRCVRLQSGVVLKTLRCVAYNHIQGVVPINKVPCTELQNWRCADNALSCKTTERALCRSTRRRVKPQNWRCADQHVVASNHRTGFGVISHVRWCVQSQTELTRKPASRPTNQKRQDLDARFHTWTTTAKRV